jgi:ribosomal protein L11 methyltransferase
MNYLAFDFETATAEQQELLIAFLSEQGFEGFEESGNSLQAFIRQDEFSEEAFEAVVQGSESLVYSKTNIENINWNQQWEESFQPVQVDDFVAIRAHFHQPIRGVLHEIIITPKMSFGTGHHATTYLVMQQMQHIDFNNKSVLDFGTGTGVLAILAEKLGATGILAIDNDEWSINNTKENLLQNNCTKIVVEQHSSIPVVTTYDIILANINLNVITENLASIEAVAKPGCKIIFSGFLTEDESAMQNNIRLAGLQYLATHQRGNWIALEASK